ncbi:MAG: aspartyl/asparaginyl beta-hydroxylase domain-containing protein [Acidimicrobiia bacterium]
MWQRLVDLTIVVGEWLLDRLDRLMARASLLPDRPFLDPTEFGWIAPLEAEWRTIRRELDDVLRHRDALPNFQDISTDQATITNDDRWKTFFLYGFGFRADENCRRCPETDRLVRTIPGMKTAMFSILSPGKHIPDHCGPYKGVVRYHLALRVPRAADRCRIRVGDDFATWEEGRSLVFDDTYEHEVWNDTDEIRVVLFVDFVRPLRFPMNVLNAIVLKAIAVSPFIQDAKRRHDTWERGYREVVPGPATATATTALRPAPDREAH